MKERKKDEWIIQFQNKKCIIISIQFFFGIELMVDNWNFSRDKVKKPAN